MYKKAVQYLIKIKLIFLYLETVKDIAQIRADLAKYILQYSLNLLTRGHEYSKCSLIHLIDMITRFPIPF